MSAWVILWLVVGPLSAAVGTLIGFWVADLLERKLTWEDDVRECDGAN